MVIFAVRSSWRSKGVADRFPACEFTAFISKMRDMIRELLFTLLGWRSAKQVVTNEEETPARESESPFPEPVIVPFADVLDLHSIPPKQVRAVVEDYLEEAQHRQVRFLRIIHGKGVGVQREMVRTILSRCPFVIAYSDAPPEAGGWGATVVTLSLKNSSPFAS